MNFADARDAVRGGTDPHDAARRLVETMTPDERLWCLDGDAPAWEGLRYLHDEDGYHRMPFAAAELERLGVPGIQFADGPRGCVVGNATAFPVSMARGATWDPALEERVGEAIGRELRAAGATLTGAVCINVLRHPAWGRAQETYGEDPLHVGEMAAALTRGLQRHVMACAKHFACNSMENARFSVDVAVDEVALHEVYLPHFRRVVDEGVAAVMTAYNSVNGEWCGHNRGLITDVLRDEWGFEGIVISDWILGIRNAAASVRAGLDIEMPYRMVRHRDLPAAIEAGEVSWDDVDAAVTRILATQLRFADLLASDPPPRETLGASEHRSLAREVAAASAVLLRNAALAGRPVLPLRRDESVAAIGRLANTVNLGDGGSSDVWDLDCLTIVDGLRAAAEAVTYHDGSDLAAAARAAAAADVAVVVVGYTYLDEGEYIGGTDTSLLELFPASDEADVVDRYRERVATVPATTKPDRYGQRPRGFSIGGDRDGLRLSDDDVALIRAVVAANPRTVAVIQSGSAVVVDDWVQVVPALVQAWYGGCQAGPGLADVLFGDVNFSGRLPFTVPRTEADLPAFDRAARAFRYDRWHGWWHLQRNATLPAFPFGYGMSYTSFAVTESAVEVQGAGVDVRAKVRNTGGRLGSDVIQVYGELPDPAAPPRLVGFQRVEIGPGDEAVIELTIPRLRLATRDPQTHAWRPPSGTHHLVVARYVGDPHSRNHWVDL